MPYKKEILSSDRANSLRVLCAEDNPNVAMVIKQCLATAGHFVECAEDGQDATERVLSAPNFYDVVITDHQMPRKNGLEFVRALRAAGYSGRIILHSTPVDERDAKDYRELKVDHVFEKAVQSHALIKLVASFRRNPSKAIGE